MGAGPAVPGYEQVRLVLLVGLDDEGRPVGSVQPENGPPVGFTGWVSLMSEISRFLRERPAPRHHAGEETQPAG
ncbi:MAG TPA: hypothetical protein VKV80_06410 [Streptosporangiaceae bacterium]|nr:hypothetical protein [Streptosporangiaceae bacterium]